MSIQTITAFHGHRKFASGAPLDVAQALAAAGADPNANGYLVFQDADGRAVDLDLSGTKEAIAARYRSEPAADEPSPRGRGRPKLGVTAREITLLPRHWDWLATQRGGASATIRRLVDEARKLEEARGNAPGQRDAAYRFLSAIGGDLPGFEEAIRALFSNEPNDFDGKISNWPRDIRDHALGLLHGP
ncbi:MAG: hypothetical protein ACJA06_002535 [Halocynthiibacter sp.]|jgi:hypothetical protein